MADSRTQRYLAFVNSRLSGMRVNRYSWWVHARELAEFFLPRRYRWLITPNMQSRGSPINQAILDSTGVLAARNLASGLMSGKSSPTRPWFALRVGDVDSTTTSAVSLWLSACEKKLRAVFHASNFYNCIAQFYYDLVIFGTAVIIIYEDFENVIRCHVPCFGEFYIDLDGSYRPCIMYREFTMTIAALVDEFGIENVSENIRKAYEQPGQGAGAAQTREVVVAHAIEPNDDGRDFGVPSHFRYREAYWQYGGGQSQQQAPAVQQFLRVRGYYEQPHACVRWDITSNDAYGRSVGMDALPDQKQLQLETRRKAQAIDKMVNPPLVADIQLKNQPASLLPGGMTYIAGYAQTGKPAMSSVYDTKFDIAGITADLEEVRGRLKYTFYNHLFQPISQFETRSNVTAVEIDQRRAEGLIMLGPVFERLDHEGLAVIAERTWGICSRIPGFFPPPPPELDTGAHIDIDFVSMLAVAQDAIAAASIERVMGLAGNIGGIDQEALDAVDFAIALDKYSNLLRNDPAIMRTPEQIAARREARAQQQAAMAQAEVTNNLAQSAKNLAAADMGGGVNALQALTGNSP